MAKKRVSAAIAARQVTHDDQNLLPLVEQVEEAAQLAAWEDGLRRSPRVEFLPKLIGLTNPAGRIKMAVT